MINSKAMEKSEFNPAGGVIKAEAHGQRLDAALAEFYPQLGLRARRRLWEWCRVTLDGIASAPGSLVRAGQRLEVLPLREHSPDAALPWGEIRLVAATPEYCALYKPGGIASARLDGGGSYSAEEYALEHRLALGLAEGAILCNRLDAPTSGLLLWAFGEENQQKFRSLEAQGGVLKHYLALVRGVAPEELHLNAALGIAGGKKTRVLERVEADAARHTLARRLSVLQHTEGPLSLMDVQIKRGARHQIRAHLAAAGWPIVGDELYGGGAARLMYLHHRRIEFAGFYAEAAPPWPLTEFAAEPR